MKKSLFPPQVVEDQVTLTYKDVNFKECKVKPRDGEPLHGEREKTVFLLRARDFYEVIVDEGEARINYHFIGIESE